MFMQNRHPLLFNALNKVDSRKKQETYLIQENYQQGPELQRLYRSVVFLT